MYTTEKNLTNENTKRILIISLVCIGEKESRIIKRLKRKVRPRRFLYYDRE